MKTKGLTLKEAIESGRPFRRKGWQVFVVVDETNRFVWEDDQKRAFLESLDIFATDWELKPDEQRNPREWKANLTSMKLFPLDADVGLAVHVQEVLPGSRLLTREQALDALYEAHESLGRTYHVSVFFNEILKRLGFDEGDQS